MTAAVLTLNCRCRSCRGWMPKGSPAVYVLGELTCPACMPPDYTDTEETP